MDSLSDSIIKLILIDNGTVDKLKNAEIYSQETVLNALGANYWDVLKFQENKRLQIKEGKQTWQNADDW